MSEPEPAPDMPEDAIEDAASDGASVLDARVVDPLSLRPYYKKRKFIIFAWTLVIFNLIFVALIGAFSGLVGWDYKMLQRIQDLTGINFQSPWAWAGLIAASALLGFFGWACYTYYTFRKAKTAAAEGRGRAGRPMARPGAARRPRSRGAGPASSQAPGRPRVVIAVDSFKGTLTSRQAGEAIAAGLAEKDAGLELVVVPVSDGGEGLVEALAAADPDPVRHSVTAEGPLEGPKVEAGYAVIDAGRTAVIEMAASSGLTQVPEAERRPLEASTWGVGTQIRDALDQGVKKIVLGLGGSATVDGGVGMAQALGGRFLDADGGEIGRGGGALAALARIDLSGLDPRLAEVEIVAAADVTTTLLGEAGAVLYAPQKGATPEQVDLLARNLARLAETIERELQVKVAEMEGAGAAGGMGAGAAAFLGARLRPGAAVVIKAVGLAKRIRGAALVITGEGRLDATTLEGKLPMVIARLARTAGVPAAAFCGELDMGERLPELAAGGIRKIYSLVRGEVGPEEACARAAELLQARAGEVFPKLKEAFRS